MMAVVNGLVTTIIPVFNRTELVQDAVHSVLTQDYPHLEIILVNDGSTDNTPEILDALSQAHPDKIQVIHKQNGGPGESREAARQIARGEFIQYLDSDDLLLPDKFSTQVAALRKSADCALAYGKTLYYRLHEKDKAKIFKQTDQKFERIFPPFLTKRRWATSSPLYRRSVLDKIGPWLPLWSEEDWEYDCRIGALNLPVYYCAQVVSEQRGLPGARLSQQGRSNPKFLKSQAEARKSIFRSALQSGILPGSPEMLHFSRQLFMLARDCGAHDLPQDARELLMLARQASGFAWKSKLDIELYSALSRVVSMRVLNWAGRLYEKYRNPQ